MILGIRFLVGSFRRWFERGVGIRKWKSWYAFIVSERYEFMLVAVIDVIDVMRCGVKGVEYDVMLASRWSVYLVLRQSEETWQEFYECKGEWESRCFQAK